VERPQKQIPFKIVQGSLMKKHSASIVHVARFKHLSTHGPHPAIVKQRIKPAAWVHPRPPLFSRILLVLLSAGLLFVSTKISIPMPPLPVTLQPLAILFISMLCGWRIAVTATVIYLALGFAGLPVLINPDYLTVWGYYLGLVLAALVTGFLSERGWTTHIFSTLITAFLGLVLLHAASWAVLIKPLGMSAAFHEGVRPFLLADVLVMIFLAALVPAFWRFFVATRKASSETTL
jgi:biotin transport system substrate-specific component